MAQERIVKSCVQHNGEAWIGNKKNAPREMDSRQVFKTTWGWMGVATTSRGVATVVLPKRSRRAVEKELTHTAGPASSEARRHLQMAQAALLRYLAGDSQTLGLALDLPDSSSFRLKVWRTLQTSRFRRRRCRTQRRS